jgi:hypothetical protein
MRSVLVITMASVLASIASGACSAPPTTNTVSPGGPDRASFGPVAKVLVQRCGSVDCHGSYYRNMRLFGFGSERLDPSNVPDSPTDITQAEIDADYDAVVGLEPEIMRQVVAEHGQRPERLTFVRKGRGQENHKGGQRIVPGDPADVCVLSWLASAVDNDACAGALTK